MLHNFTVPRTEFVILFLFPVLSGLVCGLVPVWITVCAHVCCFWGLVEPMSSSICNATGETTLDCEHRDILFRQFSHR